MKVIVAGSRTIRNNIWITETLNYLIEQGLIPDAPDLEIVSGLADGPDWIGLQLAEANGLKCHEFPADWKALGKRAGYVRNTQMAQFADAAVIFWDGKSKGTAHMIQCMKSLRKPYYLYTL